jgi:hypothetical protein
VAAPRPVLTIAGTNIVLYEAEGPYPGFVYLAPHQIPYGKTSAKGLTDRASGQSYNIVAGEPGLELPEHASEESLPARARRTPGTEGLGAEDWRERQKREAAEWEAREKAELRLRKSTRREGVDGWRASILGPQAERRIFGQATSTLDKWETLYQRLVPYTLSSKGRGTPEAVHERSSRVWLTRESASGGPLPSTDPFWTPARTRFQPWLTEACAPWIVIEGTRAGLRFAVQQYDREHPEARPSSKYVLTPAQRLARLVESYVRDPQRFSDLFGKCNVADREKGLMLATRILDLGNRTAGISVAAETLYNHYRWALKNASDKDSIHRAYHRILLHRFLRRRPLTPVGSYVGGVREAAERRAKLLQAHRVLVFNSQGCPVAWNEVELSANGIDKETLRKVYGNATLLFAKSVPSDLSASVVGAWTKWLYEEVLEIDMRSCARTVAFTAGVQALAGAGYLA